MAKNEIGFPSVPPKDDFCQIAVETKSPPIFSTFDRNSSGNLLSTVRSVIDGGKELIAFVDTHRMMARRMGIETIGIELAGMLESGGLDAIRDALEESIIMNRPSEISHEGLARLRRAEELLADVGREMDKELGTSRAELGAAGGSGDVVLWIPFVVLGAVAIGALVLSGAFTPAAPPVQPIKAGLKQARRR